MDEVRKRIEEIKAEKDNETQSRLKTNEKLIDKFIEEEPKIVYLSMGKCVYG